MNKLQQLMEIVRGAEDDYAKAMAGNKAATTRVRKIMQDVKKAANDIREEMMEVRKPTD